MDANGQTGRVTFDGSVVTITRTGLSRLTGGGGDLRIPVAEIAEVHLQPAGRLVSGFIHFASPASKRRPAAGDATSVVFAHRQAAAFEILGDEVRRAINEPRPTAGPSVADELTKLARLIELELLTREEFETAKARLLGR